MKKNINIAIVGAGLAGLSCAKQLEENTNFNITIFEKDSRIGGRIKTDFIDGFTLDHGFQVLLPRYPEVKRCIDLKKIELYPFPAGAKIDGNYIGDPLRDLYSLIPTIASGVGTIKDKLLILKLRFEDSAPKTQTAHEYLKDYGFSEEMISKFFVPFFAGVFLNKNLENSASFFLFLFKIFAQDYATLPKNGMKDLPKNIKDQLTRTKIFLNTEIKIKNKSTILINSDETKEYDVIVKATPEDVDNFYEVTTDYFYTDIESWEKSRYSSSLNLYTKTQYINHLAPVSIVNPNYAPKDKILFSVNALKEFNQQLITDELGNLFPEVEFTFIKRYVIKRALPKLPTKHKGLELDSLYRCGDYLSSPSINGALLSGKEAAKRIIKKYA